MYKANIAAASGLPTEVPKSHAQGAAAPSKEAGLKTMADSSDPCKIAHEQGYIGGDLYALQSREIFKLESMPAERTASQYAVASSQHGFLQDCVF